MSQPAPPPAAPSSRRPALVAAAVLLFVVAAIRILGIFAAVGSLGLLLGAGFIGIIGIIEFVAAIVAMVLQITGGVFVLQNRYKGFTFGVTGSAIGIAARVLDFVVVAAAGLLGFAGGFLVIGIVIVLIDIAIIVLLVQNKNALSAA